MLAEVLCAAVIGVDSVPIEIEVDIASMGLPSFTIVGLAEKSVDEAKERVRSAIRNAGATFPSKKITVNMAPAHIPKEGTQYDLAIAIGILIASGQLACDVSDMLFLGELSLTGHLRPISGVLPMSYLAQKNKLSAIFVPAENSIEASILPSIYKGKNAQMPTVYAVDHLTALFHHLSGSQLLQTPAPITLGDASSDQFEVDMQDIRGQEQAKRALEISAAGNHNMSMQGSPGVGKTMLARALRSILPRLTPAEALEVTKVYSICGLTSQDKPLITIRPFRSPHHTISQVGLVGGGSKPKPGEISLAHRGVLFLDEFPQFSHQCIESLRAPLEDGVTTIVRASQGLTFPSKLLLVTAQNPCNCGFLGDRTRVCLCTPAQIARYQKRISGPISDRIDLSLVIPKVAVDKLLTETQPAENSAGIRKRVQNARDLQTKRFAKAGIASNAEMKATHIKQFCSITEETQNLLAKAMTSMQLSARSYHRILKVARTIADLEGAEQIALPHVAEALQYRQRITAN